MPDQTDEIGEEKSMGGCHPAFWVSRSNRTKTGRICFFFSI